LPVRLEGLEDHHRADRRRVGDLLGPQGHARLDRAALAQACVLAGSSSAGCFFGKRRRHLVATAASIGPKTRLLKLHMRSMRSSTGEVTTFSAGWFTNSEPPKKKPRKRS